MARGQWRSTPILAELRKRLETIAPEALGLSRGRWNNIRSLIGKALALARPNSAGTTNGSLAARVASAFRAALAESGGGPEGHGAVFECEKRSTRRGDGSRIFEAYHKAIVSDRLRAKPEETWDAIVWTWNACKREVVRLAGYRDPS